MANLTSVGLTAGLGTSGTGTISTLDNLIGTAGTGSAQVLTVQGNASGTAVPVSLASTTLTGTVAATQSGTWTVQPGNTANTTAWKVDGSAVTQPVSLTSTTITGTVAVTESGTWSNRITDGTNTSAVKAASTAAVAADPALVVAISPNNPITLGSIAAGSNTIGSVKVTDGTNTAAVKAASTAPVAADPAMVVALSPNSSLSLGSVKILDSGGTNTGTVKAASTAAVAADPALVVAISPNNQDVGVGTGGSHTARVAIDTSQLSALQTTSTTMSTGYQLVALPSDQVKIPVQGNTASGATDADNPLKTGGLAKTSNPTAVTDGQRVASLYDKLGKQVVVGAIRDLKANQFTTITSSTTETTVVTAIASTFIDVYGVVVENTSATATKVTFKDSTAGTTRFEIYVPAGDTRGFMLPVDSAVTQATVNNNWTATCGTSVASVVISVFYVKNI